MTDNLFSLNNRRNLLTELKEKAPIIYEQYKARKIRKINEKLVPLHWEYEQAKKKKDLGKMKEIVIKIQPLEEELNIYTPNTHKRMINP